MRSILSILFFVMVVVSIPFFSDAQIPDTETMLQVSPTLPQPLESFTVSLVNLSNNASTIQWFIDGIENVSLKNKNAATLTAPATGKTEAIRVRISNNDGTVTDVRQTINPERIDMIVSADTQTPGFYMGRALPSSGSVVTVTALPFDAAKTSASRFSYLWKVDDKVQNGGALLGNNKVSFTPSFKNETEVTVQVYNSAGENVAARTITVPIVKPEVHFYEQNPLRGLSSVAVQDPYILIGDELTLQAETFYMSRNTLASNLSQEWKINGIAVANKNADQKQITLTKKRTGTSAKLSFAISNLQQLLQSATGQLTIQF